MRDLLEKARQVAEQAEVHEMRSVQQSVSFQSSKLKEVSQSEESLRTLRLIQGGRLGSAQSSKPGSDGDLLRYAQNTVKHGSPVKYNWHGAAHLACPRMYDSRLENVGEKQMLDIAREMVLALNEFDPAIMAMAGVSKSLSDVSMTNSEGFHGQDRFSQWSVFFGGELVNDEGFLMVYDYFAGTDLVLDTQRLQRRVIDAFRLARTIVPMGSGQYPVVFSPREAGSLVNPLLACLNGKAVAQGVSPFKGKVGQKLFDPRLTLRDDAHVAGAAGSRSFDREGIPTSPHRLIDNGHIASFLMDLQSAAELGMAPTGNGGPNGPAASNTILEAGDSSYEEMIGGIDEGVLIEMTMGAWAGNPYGGQVSGNIALGYRIENGKLTGRIKDAMFSVNVLDALRNQLHSLSREQSWIGNVCYPYIRLDDVNISTRS